MRQKIIWTRLESAIQGGQFKSQVEIARYLGVSPGTLSKALKKRKINISREVAFHDAPVIIEKNINAIEQLEKINDAANEILDLLMRWGRGDEEALQVLESQMVKKKIRIGGKIIEDVAEIKLKDPRALALRAMGEIREQLRLQLDLFKTLYDLQAIREFQHEVLEAIGQVSPEAREQILRKLTEKSALRSTLDFPGGNP